MINEVKTIPCVLSLSEEMTLSCRVHCALCTGHAAFSLVRWSMGFLFHAVFHHSMRKHRFDLIDLFDLFDLSLVNISACHFFSSL